MKKILRFHPIILMKVQLTNYKKVAHHPQIYFYKLLGSALELITFKSNLYATQKSKTLRLTEAELLAFIGINFIMGYHKLPSYKDYWSTGEDLGLRLISSTMSRKRFETILSHLHVNDNGLLRKNNKDKLFKIRPLVNVLNSQFSLLYHGTRELGGIVYFLDYWKFVWQFLYTILYQ